MKTHPVTYQKDITKLFHGFHQWPRSILFDSGHPSPHAGNIDIFSAIPIKTLSIDTDNITLTENNHTDYFNRIEEVKARLQKDWCSIESDHPFAGGWMGHANYELAHWIEPDSLGTPEPNDSPFFWAGYYNWAVINNHDTQRAVLVYEASIDKDTLAKIQHQLTQRFTPNNNGHFALTKPFVPAITREDYQKNFDIVKKHIRLGDCYQINYTFPFEGAYTGSPFDAYCRLRNAVPSPFMAYLSGEHTILSISPERFIKAHQQRVKTQPIKGTAPRNKSDVKLDEALAANLKRSPKDRAENVMIVDLLRNDLGKLCQPGSIKVSKLFDIESYENVHHLVSTVTGEIHPDKNLWDLFFSAFPGGSITGAPKISACKIINTIESHPRNVYCGSIFYASNNGRFDSSIAIRTLLLKDNKITASAGGGIVSDSTCDSEYDECLVKISRLLSSLT